MKKHPSLIGKKFHRLMVLKEIGRNKHGKIIWQCMCDCGNTTETLGVYLRNGDTKSCGCFGIEQRILKVKKHGMSRKKISAYETWKGMNARCNNPNHKKYPDYGGRGIKVCDRWKDFNLFFEDMGHKPTKSHSLDRFPDMDGDYSSENCRWATDYQQSRNKRNNRWFDHAGKKMIMEDWAKYFNIHMSTLWEHLKTKTFEEIYNFYSLKNKLVV